MSAGKALYRRWIDEVWTRGDVGVLDELHTPAFADRTGLPGVTPDTAGMKQFILRFRAGFPDAVFTIEDVVAEGDRIAGRWTMRGTHTGESDVCGCLTGTVTDLASRRPLPASKAPRTGQMPH